MKESVKILLGAIYRQIAASCSVVCFVYSVHEILQKTIVNYSFQFSFSKLVFVFGASFVILCIRSVSKLSRKKYMIPSTNMAVSVRIRNILKCKDGSILVGTNDSLTYDLDKIGENSIQAQLTKKYGGNWIKDAFEKEKQKEEYKNKGRVPYGYIFTVPSPSGNHQFIFLVMSRLEKDKVPTASFQDITESLDKLFASETAFSCKNHRLYCPLIGTGDTSLLYSRETIARMIAQKFVHKDRKDTANVQELVITFRLHTLKNLNLLQLIHDIEFMSRNCSNCSNHFID